MSDTNKQPEPQQSNGDLAPEAGIGDRIKKRRKDLDLTVDELSALTALCDHEAKYAEGSGISGPTIYRYESSGSKPGARELRILSEALNCSPCFLLLGEEWDKEQEDRLRQADSLVAALKALMEPSIFRSSRDTRNDAHAMRVMTIKAKRRII